VLKVKTDGTDPKIVHWFYSEPNDGISPVGGMVELADGTIYGTTVGGGEAQSGVIYRLRDDGSGFGVIHSFGSIAGDAVSPAAGLVDGLDGRIYGSSARGGTEGSGAIFSLKYDGSDYRVVRSFGDQTEGNMGPSELSLGTGGMLYGTFEGDDAQLFGSVFRVGRDGSAFNVLHSFSSPEEGRYPRSGLWSDLSGTLYGTCFSGGPAQTGTLFSVGSDGKDFEVKYSFSGGDPQGEQPRGQIVLSSEGTLFGTTTLGGVASSGVIYSIREDGSDYSVIHEFGTRPGEEIYPAGGLLLGKDGFLYGTTEFGGARGSGSIFRIRSDGGGYSNISFDLPGSLQPLVQDTKGMLYGIGLVANLVFGLNTDGTGYHIVADVPPSMLIAGNDGNLYGSSQSGGSSRAGFAFEIAPDSGKVNVLAEYTGEPDVDGNAISGITESSDGTLYGVSQAGGPNNDGVIFRVSRDGSSFIVLHSFGKSTFDGKKPASKPVYADEGTLYGTTGEGGLDGIGTVYRINVDGTGYRVLYSFDSSNGDFPGFKSPLILGRKNNLYGTTYGPYSAGLNPGTLYQIRRPERSDQPTLSPVVLRSSSGSIRLRGSALPGAKIAIESALSLNSPQWSLIDNVLPDPSGQFELQVGLTEMSSYFRAVAP
jgi:uncharacterized repeat protein (TIGR03803 family)